MNARLASPDDSAAIAAIYNQGIDDRVATFETRHRTVDDVCAWFDERHPIVVVEDKHGVIAFASTSTYRPRDCYAGIAEFSVYVEHDSRGHGAGRLAMEALLTEAEIAASGNWSGAFSSKTATSRTLMQKLGFRESGCV